MKRVYNALSLTFLRRLACVAALFLATVATHAGEPPFDPGRVGFRLTIDNVPSAYHTLFATTMPGASLAVKADSAAQRKRLTATASAGLLSDTATGWQWRAPHKPGAYTLEVHHRDTGEAMRIQMLVLVPAAQIRNGHLKGYRIGQYPRAKAGNPYSATPKGFIEVTPELENLPVSPHFTLGQFLCKQQQDHPVKYLLLMPALLVKLEKLLEDVNAEGYRTDGFFVMSGYRTPSYNKALGNVPYSRHVWGGAADIFISRQLPYDWMDDLNGDGLVDTGDAMILYDLADSLPARRLRHDLVGGVGLYRENQVRGPFVHVDIRGHRARWGIASR